MKLRPFVTKELLFQCSRNHTLKLRLTRSSCKPRKLYSELFIESRGTKKWIQWLIVAELEKYQQLRARERERLVTHLRTMNMTETNDTCCGNNNDNSSAVTRVVLVQISERRQCSRHLPIGPMLRRASRSPKPWSGQHAPGQMRCWMRS